MECSFLFSIFLSLFFCLSTERINYKLFLFLLCFIQKCFFIHYHYVYTQKISYVIFVHNMLAR